GIIISVTSTISDRSSSLKKTKGVLLRSPDLQPDKNVANTLGYSALSDINPNDLIVSRLFIMWKSIKLYRSNSYGNRQRNRFKEFSLIGMLVYRFKDSDSIGLKPMEMGFRN